MGKKILFAVMALLVMATGKIWAQDTAEKKAYAVLYQNTEKGIGSLHFMYTNEDVTQTSRTTEIPNGGSSDATTTITLTYTKAWEIDPASIYAPEWNSATEKAKITEVVFEDSFKDVKVKSCENWFFNFTKLKIIEGIKNLDTSQVLSMNSMFKDCSSLDTLDLSSFDTSSTINTGSMFDGCSNLGKITFGNNFKTSNTESMFQGCSSLKSLDLSSFDTSQRTEEKKGNMTNMFSGCSKLESLNLSSFNTSSVTYMDHMFYGCSSLNSLTLGSFDMTSVTSMYNMFYNCDNITIDGNALVFVTSEDQKNIWNGITGVRFMVKKDDEDKYVSDGTVDITLNNDKDTPVIFPYNFTANSVTFTRKFTKGKPHTVCLPFAITNTAEYGTFYKLSSYDKDNRRVKFTKVEDATEANKPYLFIPDKNKADVTKIEVKGDVDIYSTADETYTSYASNDYNTRFYGVYREKTFTEQDLNSNYDYYGWTADGNFKKAGAGASVAPCRAYIRLRNETTGGGSSDNAPARLSVEFDDGETTGIDTIGANGGADAPMYNLQGQRVGSGYKGVVIKNGKKMIVR